MIETYNIGKEYESTINRVYKGVLSYLGLKDIFDVEVSFVTEEEIRKLNNDTRDIDRVTDVLSYPNLYVDFPFVEENYAMDVDRATGNIVLGDIVICEKRMEEQAVEYGHSNERECAFLTTHGLLHLFGYDHIEESDRAIMREAEDSILNELKIYREE